MQAVRWLESFGLDLSLLSQCGGHKVGGLCACLASRSSRLPAEYLSHFSVRTLEELFGKHKCYPPPPPPCIPVCRCHISKVYVEHGSGKRVAGGGGLLTPMGFMPMGKKHETRLSLLQLSVCGSLIRCLDISPLDARCSMPGAHGSILLVTRTP